MSHSYSRLLFHIVFSTKDRQRVIVPDIRPRLHAYLGGIVNGMKGTALTIGGIDDHVHLLASLHPTTNIADAVRLLKCNSSGWVHGEWPQRADFGWQAGYGAFSVSQSAVEDVTFYINGQEQHHRKMTFQEEFLLLLKKHGIEYDERYIWD